MKIISLHVSSFGKLKNIDLQLNRGINVIQQVNSFGKTTMASFIRAMLYGFTYARNKGVTDVSRFAPWGSSDKFGGSMVVEHNDSYYRIERFFGSTARQETIRITNDKTGKELDWQKQPGEILLGLTAESYDRSAYFPQEAVELSSNENLDSRLANLVQDSAEDYDKVQERLRAYKKNLRYERGLGGEIYELECQKRQYSEQLSRAQHAEKRAEEIDKRLSDIAQEKAALSTRHAEYTEQLTQMQQKAAQAQREKETQPPKQAAKSNSPTWLYLGIALAVVAIVFLALGIAEVVGVAGYVVGAVLLTLGICGVVAHFALKKMFKRQTANEDIDNGETEDYAETARGYVNVITAISQQMSELAMETGRLSEERKTLVFNSVEVMDKLLAVDEQRQRALHRYEVADAVVKLLEQAKDNLSSSYLPKLCDRCSQLLKEITQSEFSVVVDRNFAVTIRENGQTRPISDYSRGIREITLLCFRVALSELLYDGAMPFVIIDDAFVNFDEDNFVRATALLKNLSAHAQIIYFTCHNLTGNLLK